MKAGSVGKGRNYHACGGIGGLYIKFVYKYGVGKIMQKVG